MQSTNIVGSLKRMHAKHDLNMFCQGFFQLNHIKNTHKYIKAIGPIKICDESQWKWNDTNRNETWSQNYNCMVVTRVYLFQSISSFSSADTLYINIRMEACKRFSNQDWIQVIWKQMNALHWAMDSLSFTRNRNHCSHHHDNHRRCEYNIQKTVISLSITRWVILSNTLIIMCAMNSDQKKW